MQNLEPFVPIEVLAKHFAVSISTVRAWIRQGYISRDSYINVGTTYRFLISKAQESVMQAQHEAANKADRTNEQEPQAEVDEEIEIDISLLEDLKD